MQFLSSELFLVFTYFQVAFSYYFYTLICNHKGIFIIASRFKYHESTISFKEEKQRRVSYSTIFKDTLRHNSMSGFSFLFPLSNCNGKYPHALFSMGFICLVSKFVINYVSVIDYLCKLTKGFKSLRLLMFQPEPPALP